MKDYVITARFYFYEVESERDLDERFARLDWDDFQVLGQKEYPYPDKESLAAAPLGHP